MNKFFKIVFNAKRGKMIVVNEATSSVQANKKATVAVAVMSALASGLVDANSIPSEPVIVTTGSGYNAESNQLSLVGTGTETLNIQLNGGNVQALRSYAGELTIENINKLSITGQTNLNGIHVQAPSNSSYQYKGMVTIKNVDSVEIGTKENPFSGTTAINVMGGTLDVNVNKFSVFTSDANAIWAQQTTNTEAAVVNIQAKEIDLHTASTTIGANIYGNATDPSKNSASLTLTADKLSIVSTEKTAVSSVDGYSSNVHKGHTNIQLTGKSEVNIEGKVNGININRQSEEASNSTLSVSSDGTVRISGQQNAVNISSVNELVEANATIKAPTITLDGNITMLGSSSQLGLKGTSTINGVVSAANSTLNVEGEAIFNGNADIGTLGGENAKLTLGNTQSTIKVTTNTATNTTLGATGDVNDTLGGNVEKLLTQFEGQAKVEGAKVTMAEGSYAGETTATVGADGKATNVVVKNNSLMEDTLTLGGSSLLSLNRILMNDVRKRMGDVRSMEGTTGAWARYDGGRLSATGLENDFNTIQVGADTLVPNTNWRVGLAASYTKGDNDFRRGSADLDAYMLTGYGLWMADNGMFADVVARLAKAENDMTVDGGAKAGKLDNRAYSLSGEFGWRFDLSNQYYVEPQAELTYTYVDSEDLDLGSAQYKFDTMTSLLGRVGVATGIKCPNNKGDLYFRVSAVHEFDGDAKITGANGTSLMQDGKDTWVEYGIGGNFNLTPTTYFWADLERTAGATLETDWRATFGVRHAF